MTDVFGHRFANAQLLADEYTRKGYFVVIPDILNGDACPEPGAAPPGFSLQEHWMPKHTPEVTYPIVEKALAGIIAKYSPKYIVATGFCFGAKYAIRLLGDKKVHVAGVFHPSFVTIDEIKAIKGPLFIGGAEIDQVYTEELRAKTEAALKEIKATYFTTLFSGVSHGFAVRGDLSDPNNKWAKEQAFKNCLAFFERFAAEKGKGL